MSLTTEEKRGWLLIAAVALFVAIVLGTYVVNKLRKPNVGADNCIYEDRELIRRALSAHTVIVIDQSEALSPSHKRQVKDRLLDYLTNDELVELRSVVMLYVFGKNDFKPSGEGQKLVPKLLICKPPSSGNEMVENAKKISRVFWQSFILPLNREINMSLGEALGERSPILEMIQYVSRSQDIKEVPGKKSQKTLIVVSDLLQHSDTFSHYRKWSYQAFRSSVASVLASDLRGWEVRILVLQRYGKSRPRQDARHLEFWERYFHDSGAKIKSVEAIP